MTMQNNFKKGPFRQLAAAFMLIAVALISCSREEVTESNLVTLYPIMSNEIEPRILTRAQSDNYTPYSGHRQNIYAEAVAYSGVTHLSQYDASGWFLPDLDNEGRWFSRLNVHSGQNYYLYCYTSMPVDAESMPTFTFTSKSNVKLTFSGFDIITTIDPLVSTASWSKLLCDQIYLEAEDYPALNDDRFGNFDIKTVESGTYKSHPASTKVFLALDHLFAKATLSFKVADKYNDLYTIKLIEATISTDKGLFTGTHTYSFVDRTFTLDNNGQYADRDLSIDLVNGPSVTVDESRVDSEGMIELDNTATELAWFCFLPRDNFPQLDLNVKYNVYDKKGNLLRENQTATNPNLIRVQEPVKGQNYIIRVNINPSFVYQMGDAQVESELPVEDQ